MDDRPNAVSEQERPRQMRIGLVYAVCAYLIYGIMPTYMKLLKAVPPGQIMAHRLIWSVALLALIVTVTRRWDTIRAAFARGRTVFTLILSALLIGGNWLLYIWAVLHNRVLETSLGFFITPLMTVLLGLLVLKERLRGAQALAVGLAAIGVIALAIGHGGSLWIALVLAVTFSTYGLIRKVAPVDPLCGLLIETMMLAPVAIAWLWWVGAQAQGAFGADSMTNALLVMTGVVTALPLLLFTAATKRMPYSQLGPLQYLAPTLQFLQAVLIFGEPFSALHLFTFVCIWTGLAIFVVDMLRTSRSKSRPISLLPLRGCLENRI